MPARNDMFGRKLVWMVVCASSCISLSWASQAERFSSARHALGFAARARLPQDWITRLKHLHTQPIIVQRPPFWRRWTSSKAWVTPKGFAQDISADHSEVLDWKLPSCYRGKSNVFGPYYDVNRPLHSNRLLNVSMWMHPGAGYNSTAHLGSLHQLLPWAQIGMRADTGQKGFIEHLRNMQMRLTGPGSLESASPAELAAASSRASCESLTREEDLSCPGASGNHTIWQYMTSSVDDLLSQAMQQERFTPLAPLLALNPKQVSLNVWAGPAGVVSPAHYDGDFNTYVQMAGLKRFYLWSPDSWRAMQPYPFLHPMHAQASVNVSSQPALHASAIIADLRPGDMLMLPAGWWHEVVAVTDSVSFNVWSGSHETQHTTEALFKLTAAFVAPSSAHTTHATQSKPPHPTCSALSVLRLLIPALQKAGVPAARAHASTTTSAVSASGQLNAEAEGEIQQDGLFQTSCTWLYDTLVSRFQKPSLARALSCPSQAPRAAQVKTDPNLQQNLQEMCRSGATRMPAGAASCPGADLSFASQAAVEEFTSGAQRLLQQWPAALRETLAGNWVEYALAIRLGVREAACVVAGDLVSGLQAVQPIV